MPDTVFTTSSIVKSAMGIPAGITTHDSLIASAIDWATSIIHQYCGVASLTQATYSEKIDILDDGTKTVRVRNRPLVSIAALTDNGSLIDSDEYYFEETGHITLEGSSAYFTTGRQEVEVTYTAGYETVPKAIQAVATAIAIRMVNAFRHIGYETETLGKYRYQIDKDGITQQERSILAPYMKIL